MKTERTPGPWRVVTGSIYGTRGLEGMDPSALAYDTSCPIAHMDREPGNGTRPIERDVNAAFIVKACNAHDELVNTLKLAVETIYLEVRGEERGDNDLEIMILTINAALASAEGKAK